MPTKSHPGCVSYVEKGEAPRFSHPHLRTGPPWRGARPEYAGPLELAGAVRRLDARAGDGEEELIQVCSNLDAEETRDREIRALLAAADEHPRASLHLVTLATDTVRGLPTEVDLHAAAIWLLEANRPQ